MPKARPDIVHHLREGKGWSQDDLANKAGIDAKTMSRLLRGGVCNISTIAFVAGALGVEPADIIDDGNSAVQQATHPGSASDRRVEVTVTVSLPFETFDQHSQLAPMIALLIEAIKAAGTINVTAVEPGSIRLTLEMDAGDANSLFEAFLGNQLDDLPASELTVPFNIRDIGMATAIANGFGEHEVLPVTPFIAITYFLFRLQSSGVVVTLSGDDALHLTKTVPDDYFTLMPASQLRDLDESVIQAAIDIVMREHVPPAFPCRVALKLSPDPSLKSTPQLAPIMRDLVNHLRAAGSTGVIESHVSGVAETLRVYLKNTEDLHLLTESVIRHLLGYDAMLQISLVESASLLDEGWKHNAIRYYRLGHVQWMIVASLIRDILISLGLHHADFIPAYPRKD
jgi:transcriptional regulator with XRE-family HTH domain